MCGRISSATFFDISHAPLSHASLCCCSSFLGSLLSSQTDTSNSTQNSIRQGH
ncbi:hypothetical protein HanIR_Chr05g0231911 [Helianthus annuus]|nr:hypothetical protein HanIR_Chr05g0231911 [Helianthus annuus]